MIPLSQRQMDVLILLASGATTREMAEALGVSPRTVETHVKVLMSKFAIRTRAGLVGYAYQLGYLGDEAA